ncbi:MAG: phage tail sheath family protein [Chloroflexia bacterium]|nr:phage tail sheath family protein [Chloroflexia bacterium]
MPTVPTYPGVYIEEVPSGSRTIVGVATSITAFIGRAKRGPLDTPVLIENFGDFSRIFGGLWVKSALGYSVQQYYSNGGGQAIIVRVDNGGSAASINLLDESNQPALQLQAASPGAWGNNLRVIVDHSTVDGADHRFNLFIQEFDPTTEDPTTNPPTPATTVTQEEYRNVSIDEDDPRYVSKVLETSLLVDVVGTPTVRPAPTLEATESDGSGDDGVDIGVDQITEGENLEANRRGIYALEAADIFNMMVIPPLTRSNGDVPFDTVYTRALAYCEKRRAMLIMDPPKDWVRPDLVVTAVRNNNVYTKHKNSMIYWPRVRLSDPLKENRLEEFAPSGIIAGVIARTDAQRGVWKAPAGTEASLLGVREFSYKMTDNENGRLNPLGVNALRTFPVIGRVAWGARTTAGADQLASEWKYVPVRRLALFIEESLYRGTQWAVFEPNDAPLWAQLRKAVGGFMQNLFRQGAFQGATPSEAYLVKCDSETTTQADIDRGIVNVVVGFAPLKPAEFIIIRIQQLAREES